jgi:hypothetical protein
VDDALGAKKLGECFYHVLVEGTNVCEIWVRLHVDIGLVESHFNIHVFNTCKTVW